MKSIRSIFTTATVLVLSLGAHAQTGEKNKDPHGINSPHDTAALRKLAKESVEKGLDYLIKNQNEDGSWGNRRPEMNRLSEFGFRQLNIGGHDGVRLACTSICASALLAYPDRTEAQEKALQKAIKLLIKPDIIAFKKGETFNVWGYTYKLEFLADLGGSHYRERYKDQIQETITHCIDHLALYQQHEGGWMYYSSVKGVKSDSTSFTTGVVLNALIKARKNGFKVSEKMEKDAARVVLSMRTLNSSFVYSTSHIKGRYTATRSLGATSRTAVCTLALLESGDLNKAQAQKGIDVFNTYARYLEEARKHLKPHAGAEGNASYYYYFGYNYVSMLAIKLDTKQEEWDKYAWSVLRHQEKDGRWWDTPCGEYGSKWGTGFAIQTLLRFINKTEPKTKPQLY